MSDRYFELEGLRWGDHEPIQVATFAPGGPEARTQDTENAIGDGVYVGRDYLGSATWSWELFTDVYDETQALDLTEQVARRWYDPAIRTTPGKVVPLRYFMAGRWRRVYGRPRRYAGPDGGILTIRGRADITVDFLLVHHLIYDDIEDSAAVNAVPPTWGGFTFPLAFPMTMEAPPEEYQHGIFRVGGSIPTPAVVDVHGPVTDGWVDVDGTWRIELVGTVRADETLTVDTRPWVRSVFRNGVPAAGMLTPRTRMSDLVLTPGSHRIVLGGNAATGTATATVRWRNANLSL